MQSATSVLARVYGQYPHRRTSIIPSPARWSDPPRQRRAPAHSRTIPGIEPGTARILQFVTFYHSGSRPCRPLCSCIVPLRHPPPQEVQRGQHKQEVPPEKLLLLRCSLGRRQPRCRQDRQPRPYVLVPSTCPSLTLPAARPVPQPSSFHSKLVTAKLTSTAQLSTTTGPGWSRPNSATPPVSNTPSSSSNAPPPLPPAPAPAVPQFPHAGKVIQPQPRNPLAASSPLVKKDTATKPAWGNAKPLPVISDSTARSDFPTAAEVAQG